MAMQCPSALFCDSGLNLSLTIRGCVRVCVCPSVCVSHWIGLDHFWFKYPQPRQWHWYKYLNTSSQGSGIFKYTQPVQWHWYEYLNTPSQGSGFDLYIQIPQARAVAQHRVSKRRRHRDSDVIVLVNYNADTGQMTSTSVFCQPLIVNQSQIYGLRDEKVIFFEMRKLQFWFNI